MMPSKRILFLMFALVAVQTTFSQKFHAGTAIRDVTSVITEERLYGYARKKQDSRGLHTRQYSRAYVVSQGEKTVAIAVVDVCMISQALKKEVIRMLYNKLHYDFTYENLLLLATHSHSLPGGFHQYYLYLKASNGFNRDVFHALADGISDSIVEAYKGRRESDIEVISGELEGVAANRSPYAYNNNPPSHRQPYKDDTEKAFEVLRMTDKEGKLFGLLSFFGVHQTSITPSNHLVSSDSFGSAALKTHKALASQASKSGLVTAYAQAFSGDVTPNINGSRCETTNELCSEIHSNCSANPAKPRLCTGRGFTEDQFLNAQLIGDSLSRKTIELHKKQKGWTSLQGELTFIHQWVNMSEQIVEEGNETIRTCSPSLGYAFGAGSTDGPGLPPFLQGSFEQDDAVEKLTDKMFQKLPSNAECHSPKPIFLDTGALNDPVPWQPSILPLQVIRIGSVVLVAAPVEVTTMAGRTLKKALQELVVSENLPQDTKVFILSLSNSYSSYLTTPSEYKVQRYEGASTLYGKDTLSLYTHHYKKLFKALARNQSLSEGIPPPDLTGFGLPSLGPIKYDMKSGQKFGEVLENVGSLYQPGDVAKCSFRAGNPRNVMANEITFLEVQVKDSTSGAWSPVFTDADWETKMHWKSACHNKNERPVGDCQKDKQLSEVEVEWDIPLDQTEGVYRLVHYGVAHTARLELEDYTGISGEFKVVR